MNANHIIQLTGLLYFVLGLGFIFNRKYYKNIFKDFVKSKSLLLLSGFSALVIGFIIILFFNEWTLSKQGLVTFIGWVSFIKGVSLLLFPKKMMEISELFTKKKYFNSMVFGITLAGLLLIYLGFLA